MVKNSSLSIEKAAVRGVELHRLPVIADPRGNLTFGEFEKTVPFSPKRYFMVYGVPEDASRGEHAHRECHQLLLCVKGSVTAVVDDGTRRQEFLLDSPALGLYMPPLTWGTQYKYSPDAVLLVFASHHYDPDDYIRTFEDFKQALK